MYNVLWRRYWAMAVDRLVTGLGGVLLSLIWFSPGQLFSETSNLLAPGLPMMLTLVCECVYYSLMESSKYQATLGKMLLGIVVVDWSHERLSFGQAFVRYLGRILSGFILSLGYIMAIFSDKRLALHDKIAVSYVVHKEKLQLHKIREEVEAKGDLRSGRMTGFNWGD